MLNCYSVIQYLVDTSFNLIRSIIIIYFYIHEDIKWDISNPPSMHIIAGLEVHLNRKNTRY